MDAQVEKPQVQNDLIDLVCEVHQTLSPRNTDNFFPYTYLLLNVVRVPAKGSSTIPVAPFHGIAYVSDSWSPFIAKSV